MNQDIKEKWVAALRSGEYKQGKNRLRTHTNKFCCLGVLCDLHAKETGNPWDEYGDKEFAYLYKHGDLPRKVSVWAGFPRDDANPFAGPHRLSTYNDNYGKNFHEIADIIEKNL